MHTTLLSQLDPISNDEDREAKRKNVNKLIEFFKDDNQTQLLLEEISKHKENHIDLTESGAIYRSLIPLGITLESKTLSRQFFENGIKFLHLLIKQHPKQDVALRAAEALGSCADLIANKVAIAKDLKYVFSISRKELKHKPLKSFLIAETLIKLGVKETNLLEFSYDILKQPYKNFTSSTWNKHSRAAQSIEKLIGDGLLQKYQSLQAIEHGTLILERINYLLSSAIKEYKDCDSCSRMRKFLDSMDNIKYKITRLFETYMYDNLIKDIIAKKNITFEKDHSRIECMPKFLATNLLNIAIVADNEDMVDKLYSPYDPFCRLSCRCLLGTDLLKSDKLGLTPKDYAFMAGSSNSIQQKFANYKLSVEKINWDYSDSYIKLFVQAISISSILFLPNIINRDLIVFLSTALFFKTSYVLETLFPLFSIDLYRDYPNLNSINDFIQYKLHYPDKSYINFTYGSDASCKKGYKKIPAEFNNFCLENSYFDLRKCFTRVAIGVCRECTWFEEYLDNKREAEKIARLKEEKQKLDIEKAVEKITQLEKENHKLKEKSNKFKQDDLIKKDSASSIKDVSNQDQSEGSNLLNKEIHLPEDQSLTGDTSSNGNGEL